MASSSIVLSEEQFHCSICLDVFTEPVSIPCGHNYCKACIRGYWDSTDLCQCPMCKKTFDKRPDLFVNTFISEMAAQLKKLAPVMVTPTTPGKTQTTTLAKPGEVPCDVCTGGEHNALKSCLVCLASFCETHLEPHQRVASFKKHKLIDPVENLEDRVCKKHERPLELFCRTDQMCVCQFCTETDHKTHKTVPIEEEYRERKTQMRKTKGKVQEMIQERLLKVKEIKQAVDLCKRNAEREIADSMEVFTVLVRCIERSQAELIEVVEEKQKVSEKRAERFIEELEQEITELKRRTPEIEHILDIKDLLLLLQTSPSSCTLPPTKNWSEVTVQSGLGVGTLRRAVSQVEETLNKIREKLCDAEMKRVQQWAVDVTLDPDTAHPGLILAADRKQVRYGDITKVLHDNQKRFVNNPRVLGREGFSSGRFYYEVQVEGKSMWVLGVARESINRKDCGVSPSPVDGYWTVGQWNMNEYKAHAGPWVNLSLREKPQQVGVFVDYEEGEVSFYNVEARSHIYSFTDCTFTERLYPFFSTGTNTSGDNSAPLIIFTMKSD
ncbi:E3 ubiquitin-protein ligase TRIM39 [Salvelinus sp. IW2-2015]|uniref:E3 ubiquitin-protein ligase TRIM39 n=1 Tax=Salvelinus sp. IW2-2015 TaxID=2691554 RepID=UPI000CEB0F2F|nr:E3 ubiquitin-protein ligase TRIM39-like [Salvelinus alpinus]XP_023999242.1 E3 ubiquitin-protein ligase TRIM39-like [Salvelinus alpinus]